jgi:hypothetical protein
MKTSFTLKIKQNKPNQLSNMKKQFSFNQKKSVSKCDVLTAGKKTKRSFLIVFILFFAVQQSIGQNNTGIGYVNSNTIGIWSTASASNTPVISVTSQESVGIGTNTPPAGYKLAVTGSAIFTKVKVQQVSSWPDYVFKKNYQLPSLSYTENFIRKYQHLPGVPSAAEVEKNGIDVSETQAILLKKIEELTLYIIEQDKKLEQQDRKLKELEEKMSLK